MEERVGEASGSRASPAEPGKEPGASPVGAIGLLLALYLLTRVGSLSVLPVFLDEAVHIQWAERLWSEGRILRPVGAGRLLAVATYSLAGLFEDRLFGARLIACLAGAATLLSTILLARRLFGSRAGVIAGLLYLVSPFALVYDRLALSDGFLSATLTGLLLATLKLVRDPRRRNAFGLVAVLVMLSVLSKVSALLFFVPLPLALLTLPRGRSRPLLALSLAFALGLLGAAPMLWFFLHNGAEIFAQHVADPLAESSLVASTLSDMGEWLRHYFSPAAILLGLVSLVVLRDGPALWMGASVVLPFLFFALFSNPWSARYVLPTLPPLLVLISGGVEALAGKVKGAAGTLALLLLVGLASFSGLSFSAQLLSDPSQAPFPKDDRDQLVTGWPAGYGIRELSIRLRQEAGPRPITAFVDTGGPRTLATSLAILLASAPQVRLVEGDFASAAVRTAMIDAAAGGNTFAIVGPRNPGLDFAAVFEGRTDRLAVFARPGGEWAATLFAIDTPKPPAGSSSPIPGSSANGRVP